MTSTTNPTSTSSVETAAGAWLAAVNAHDPDAAADCFTPDGLLVNLGTGETQEGREAIRSSHASLFAEMSELVVTNGPYLVDGDRYADEWTMSGVHTGDRPGLPATMKPFRITGANVGEVRDGRIARVSVYWNMVEFLVQVGIMPPPGG